MKKTALFLMLFALGVYSGCGDDESSDGDTGGFYEATLDVAPSFSPAASNARLSPNAVTTTWESGNPVYELFYILREFNPDTDQGVIDTSNLYKTMWEARNFFSNTKSQCTAITEQTITPPFDFGNDATTYTCAYNEDAANGYDFGGAYKELDANGAVIPATEASRTATDAAVKYGLFGFVWVDSTNPHNEYGTLQGVLNTTTNDLSLDIAVWVDYTDQNDYCYRNDIEGNTDTHAFTFRSMKGNKVEGSSYTSIVGKGVSQGEGEYFLLKLFNNEFPAGKYYCIAATDGEAELQAMEAAGFNEPDANCAEYQTDVDAMTPFTTDNLACAEIDFNPGGTGTAAQGTIFLNYQSGG